MYWINNSSQSLALPAHGFSLRPYATRAQLAVLIDEKGASLDSHEFAPVEHLFLDDVKAAAKRLIRIHSMPYLLKCRYVDQGLTGSSSASRLS